jgi:hypothetical protein
MPAGQVTFLDLPSHCVLRIYAYLDSDGGAWSRQGLVLDALALSQTCRYARAVLRMRMRALVFPRLSDHRRARNIPTATPSYLFWNKIAGASSSASRHAEPSRMNEVYAATAVRVAGEELRDLRCPNELLVRTPMTRLLREIASDPIPPLQHLVMHHRIVQPDDFGALLKNLRPSLRHLGIMVDSDCIADAVANAHLTLDGLGMYISPGTEGDGRFGRRSMYTGADKTDVGGLTPAGLSNMLASAACGNSAHGDPVKGITSLYVMVTGNEASPALLDALVTTFKAHKDSTVVSELTIELIEGMEGVRSVKWAMQLIFACAAFLNKLTLIDYHVPEIEEGTEFGGYGGFHGGNFEYGYGGEEDGNDDDDSDHDESSDRITDGGKMNGRMAQQIVHHCPHLLHVNLINTQYVAADTSGIIRAFGSRLSKLIPVFGMSDAGLSDLACIGSELEEVLLEFQSPELTSMLSIAEILRNSAETLRAVTLRRCGERQGQWKPELEPWTRPLCHSIRKCAEHEGGHACHSLIWTLRRLPELFRGFSALEELNLDVAVHLDDFEELLANVGPCLRDLACDNVLRRSSSPVYRDAVDYENSHVDDLCCALRVVAAHCARLEVLDIMTRGISSTNCKRGMACCHNQCAGECRRRVEDLVDRDVRPRLPRLAPASLSCFASHWWTKSSQEEDSEGAI